MKVVAMVEINAPIDKVFEYFSDIQKVEDRIEGITKIEILSKEKSGAGLKWRETRKMFGKEATEVMWITAFSPPVSYSVDAESHGMKYHSTYTFNDVGGGTTVEMVFEGTPVSLGAKITAPIFGLIFKGATKKALQKDMHDLKRLLEK